ncbi:MAG: TonB-dependent receptor, partial [Bacteroidota bacterium]
ARAPLAADVLPQLDTLSLDRTSEPDLGFYDMHAAGLLVWPNGQSLHASFYRGWNHLNGNQFVVSVGEEGELPTNRDAYTWVNETAQLRYTRLVTPHTVVSAQARSSRYGLEHEYAAIQSDQPVFVVLPGGEQLRARPVDGIRPADDGNRVRELGVTVSAEHIQPAGLHLKSGLEWRRVSHRFSVADAWYQPIRNEDVRWRGAGYADARFQPWTGVSLSAGLRATYLKARGSVYAEPRARAEVQRSGFTVAASAGLYRQFVNQFEVSSASPSALLSSIRFWLPVDETVAPPKALHLALSASVALSPAFTLRAEAYEKRQDRLLFIDYPALWNGLRTDSVATTQAEFLGAGRGSTRGIEMGATWRTSSGRLTASYAWTQARRATSFSEGEALPAPWNQPHRVDLALDWTPTPQLTLLARWAGVWGRTWAYRRAYYDYLATDPLAEPVVAGVNFREPQNHTLPALLQLDLGAAYAFAVGPTNLQLRLDALNALARTNIADYALTPTEEGDVRVVPRRLVPFMPSISLRAGW